MIESQLSLKVTFEQCSEVMKVGFYGKKLFLNLLTKQHGDKKFTIILGKTINKTIPNKAVI